MIEQSSLLSNLDGLGLAARAALDALGHRAVDVMVRDPALVVVLVRTGGGAGGLIAGEGLDLDLLDLLRCLGALGLREECLDPGLVDKVERAAEDAGKDEVQEDAVRFVRMTS